MKYRLLFTLILLLWIIAGCAPQMLENAPRVETTGTVNLRAGPGLDYQVIASIPKGTNLILLDSTNDWQQVRVSDRLEGWISKSFTRMAGYEQVIINTQTKVRSGPGEEYKAFAILLQGRTFSIIGEKDNWYHVVLPDGNMGWIVRTDARKVSKTNITTTRDAVVRESPNSSARQLITVEKGRELIQMDRKGAWYQVKVGSSIYGWIHEDALKPVPEQNIVVPQKANVRKGPSTVYDIIEIVDASDRLTELERKDDWYKVRTPSGNVGWVNRSVVRPGTSQTPYTPSTRPGTAGDQDNRKYDVRPEYLVTKQDCNIRQGYSTNFPVLTRASEGAILLRIGKKSNWNRVKYPPNGEIGWVRNDLVQNSRGIYLTTEECNIRQGYNTTFRVIKRVPAGTMLSRIEEQHQWYRMRMSDGRIGWIHPDLVTSIRNGFFTNQECNVRSGPGTSHARITRLDAGQFVSRISSKGDWLQFKLPAGGTGWIRKDLVARTDQIYEVSKFASVRSGNSESQRVVTSLSDKNRVYQINSKGNWMQVRIHPSGIGWIKKDQLLPAYLGNTSLIPTLSNSALETDTRTLTTIQPTNIRRGPDLRYEVAIRVGTGTKMIVLAEEGEWYQVKLANGLTGYVHYSVFTQGGNANPAIRSSSQALTVNRVSTPQYTAPKIEKVYAGRDLNVRTLPDSNSARVRRISANTEMQKLDQRLNWTQVELSGGQKGWIFTPLLSAAPLVRSTASRTKTASDIVYTVRATNVRVSPDSNAARLDRLPARTGLKKVSEQNNWTRVQLKDNRYGWIFSPLLSQAPSGKTIDPVVAQSGVTTTPDIILEKGILRAKKKTSIRSGPDKSYQIVDTVPAGTRLTSNNITGDWYQVDYKDGKIGYVASQDVDDVADRQLIVIESADVKRSRELTAETIYVVHTGTVLNTPQEVNGWYQIGSDGWIRSNHVRDVKFPAMRAVRNTDVHREPSTRANKMSSLKEGDEAKPLREDRGWYLIELSGGLSGWVVADALQTATIPKIRTRANASVYESPSIQSNKITSLAGGAEFAPLYKRGEWVKIPVDAVGAFGWIYSSDYSLSIKHKMRVTGSTFVREGPGIEYRIVETVDTNNELTCTEERGGWCLVVTSAQNTGWVNSQFTIPVSFSPVSTVKETAVRTNPAQNAPTLERVPAGSELIPVNEMKGWYEVRTPGGSTGWIRKTDLQNRVTQRIVFTLDLCDIRSGPGAEFPVKKRVDPATDLTIIGEQNDWYKVRVARQNLEGWIKKDLVFE